uniref:Carbohydrate sulfotransferase n=1 Tax=Crocodylus porosus TaxID=8502 RepID=A0A7M4FKX5_CROPO
RKREASLPCTEAASFWDVSKWMCSVHRSPGPRAGLSCLPSADSSGRKECGFQQSSLQAIHQQRRELLSSVCNRYTRKRRLLTPDDLRHLVVDDVHGLLYCYVPKVACTNWKRVMMVLTGQGKYQDPLEIPANEAHVSSNLRTLSEYSISEINHRLRNYLKFIFVREPFERLVSAYRNKFTRMPSLKSWLSHLFPCIWVWGRCTNGAAGAGWGWAARECCASASGP